MRVREVKFEDEATQASEEDTRETVDESDSNGPKPTTGIYI